MTGYEPPWLFAARSELGVHETPGPESTARIIEYDRATTLAATNDQVPWCSAFVCWCMEKAGFPSTRSAAAKDWETWGTQVSAIVGAIGVIQWDNGTHHVTIVAGKAPDGRLVCIGGNQNDSVNYSAFLRTRFVAFRWPALPQIDAATLAGMKTPGVAETR